MSHLPGQTLRTGSKAPSPKVCLRGCAPDGPRIKDASRSRFALGRYFFLLGRGLVSRLHPHLQRGETRGGSLWLALSAADLASEVGKKKGRKL